MESTEKNHTKRYQELIKAQEKAERQESNIRLIAMSTTVLLATIVLFQYGKAPGMLIAVIGMGVVFAYRWRHFRKAKKCEEEIETLIGHGVVRRNEQVTRIAENEERYQNLKRARKWERVRGEIWRHMATPAMFWLGITVFYTQGLAFAAAVFVTGIAIVGSYAIVNLRFVREYDRRIKELETKGWSNAGADGTFV